MKTKVVYVLVSNDNDFYFEQALISVCSVKVNSPNSFILLVVDDKTNSTLKGKRGIIKQYVNEIKVVDLGLETSNAFRSRILKTTLRSIVEGPYLFVDTDTVVCSPLDEIDALIDSSVNIAAVPDAHCKFKEMSRYSVHTERSRIIGWDLDNDEFHFNSGVMFVADNEFTHDFYQKWNSNWNYERKFNLFFDQLALAYTNGMLNYPIRELSGIWNCQIATNGIYYFASAKILHLLGGYHDGCPYFFSNLFPYIQLKNTGEISAAVWDKIKNPKSAFIGDVKFIGNSDSDFIKSSLYGLFVYHKSIYNIMDKFGSFYFKLRRIAKKVIQ